MKKAIHDAKWWMFLPFAGFSIAFSKWVFDGETIEDRYDRDLFYMINEMITCVISIIIIGIIIVVCK